MVLMWVVWGAQPPAATGYQDTATVTILSITVHITCIAVIITSPFHVVNPQARTSVDRCSSFMHLAATLPASAALRTHLTLHSVCKAAL